MHRILFVHPLRVVPQVTHRLELTSSSIVRIGNHLLRCAYPAMDNNYMLKILAASLPQLDYESKPACQNHI